MANTSQDITRVRAELHATLTTIFRETTAAVAQRLSRRSPVKSGRFINNWNASVGRIDTRTTVAVDPSGMQALDRMHVVARSAQLGHTVYLTESLPYAARLEDGWSGQAPNGMVGITVAEVPLIFEDVVRRVR